MIFLGKGTGPEGNVLDACVTMVRVDIIKLHVLFLPLKEKSNIHEVRVHTAGVPRPEAPSPPDATCGMATLIAPVPRPAGGGRITEAVKIDFLANSI